MPGFVTSSTRSWFLNTWCASGAFISQSFVIRSSFPRTRAIQCRSPNVAGSPPSRGTTGTSRKSWLQHHAPLDVAVVDRLEDAVDVVERVRFHERLDRDLAVEHEVERGRVMLGRAAPVAER